MAKATDEPKATESAQVEFVNVVSEGGLDDVAAAGHNDDYVSGGMKEQPGVISEEMAGTLLQAPFAVAAAYWGEHWNLSKGEVELMAPPAARVFSELFGQWAGKYPDAYMLGFSLIMAAAPRAAVTVQAAKAKKARQDQAGEGGAETLAEQR